MVMVIPMVGRLVSGSMEWKSWNGGRVAALTGDAWPAGRRARRPRRPPAPPAVVVMVMDTKRPSAASEANLLRPKIGLDNGGHFRSPLRAVTGDPEYADEIVEGEA